MVIEKFMVRQLLISLFLLFSSFSYAQTSPINLNNISLVFAGGALTTPPRHADFLMGFSEPISNTENFFAVVGLSPSPLNHTEQTQILLGITQQIGTTTLFGLPFKSWVSEAWGASLVNVGSLSYSGSPSNIVASASTNKSFTAQYVIGFAYVPPKNPKINIGPVVKYTRVSGQPSTTELGIYIKYSLK